MDILDWKIILRRDHTLKELNAVLEKEGFEAPKTWAKPPKAELGDFALNIQRYFKAWQAQNPEQKLPDFGHYLCERFKAVPEVLNCEAQGAFLNITVTADLLAQTAWQRFYAHTAPKPFAKERVMVEYSQPNTHKSFHVGHVRNVCLGDALVRMYRHLGYDVISANYIGDEGMHVAKCLWQLKKEQDIVEDGDFLGEVYARAAKALSDEGADHASAKAEISEILSHLESNTGEDYLLWQKSKSWSMKAFAAVYEYLGVTFDHYFYESELTEDSQKIVDEYLKKGVFVESDGAVGCPLDDVSLGFMIARKKDGNTLYATKDLALAKIKFENFNIDQSIYVVASEQNFHFKQVFATLLKMGFKNAAKCYHLSYGHVRLPHGKMSSRDGQVVRFLDLRDNIDVALTPLLKSDDPELKRKLVVASIRFGMLATDPQKDVVYNAEDWVSFEGQTGPYMLYSYARAKAILRKKPLPENHSFNFSRLTDLTEKQLMVSMLDFDSVLEASALAKRPSSFVHYLYDTSRIFNRFYANLPILKEPDTKLSEARLGLVLVFASFLQEGLKLIGIETVESM
jgi:arginyl-tRNA synthetase